jgi:hypothetical protein
MSDNKQQIYIDQISVDTAPDGYVLASNGTAAVWALTAGVTGYTGSQGDTGSTGFTGSKGDAGAFGFTGSQGEFGYTGSQGVLGYSGSVGFVGSSGFTGSQGDQGTFGYTGSQGELGYTGSIGPIGYTGSAAEGGSASVNTDASYTWTNTHTFTSNVTVATLGFANSLNIAAAYMVYNVSTNSIDTVFG